MEKYRNVFKVRGLLMAPPVLFMSLVTMGEYERDWVVLPVGFAIFLMGVALRVWAQMHLHYRLSVHKTLTTTGPYALVRNPIYIANTTMLLGLTVSSELLWFLPVTLAWCVVVYHFVVRYEEAHLTVKYGDGYRIFMAATPRWLPRIPARRLAVTHAMRQFLRPSISAELHCLLLVIPFLAKEIFLD